MLVHPQFDPVAIAIGPLQVHWYGLTYLVAFGLFLWLAARRVRYPWLAEAGWTRRDVEDLLFYGVVGVPKICGLAPASFRPMTAASARRCRPELQGVIVEWPLATPIIGLEKSAGS